MTEPENRDIVKDIEMETKRAERSEIAGEAVSWAKTVVFAVVFALLINNFVIVNASVFSGSMEDTLMTDDRIVAFRLSYLFGEPKLYDIVLFRFPDDESKLYVKRVIGLPGDKVEIRDGKVYINDAQAPLRDDFIKGSAYGDYGPYFVPEGHYFMMGDNRERSEDSRHWRNKFVAKNKILGKAILKYYPGFKNLNGK